MSTVSGYCAAVADIARMGHDDIAAELLVNAGFSLDTMTEAGTDDYDLEEIEKLVLKDHK